MRRTLCQAALALLCLSQRPAAAAEVLLNLSPQRGLSRDAAGLWVLGQWPLKGTLSLPGLLVVQVDAGCSHIQPDIGQEPRTLILQGYETCSDSALYALVTASLSGRPNAGWGVLLIGSDEQGSALHLANWASMPNPPFFPGVILSVAKSWGDQLIRLAPADLEASSLAVRQSVQPVVLDTPVTATVAQGHTNTYTYHHDGSGSITIAVTPTFGDPDIYVSLGSNLTETLGRPFFDKSEESPGDDVMLVEVEAAKPFVVIVVEGADASEYTMVLSTDHSLVPLSNGRSVRYEAAADAYRFFSVRVDAPGDVRFAVTPLTGDPDLFVALSPRPTEASAVWASAEPELAERLHRYEHLAVLGTDPKGCAALPCVYYLSVLADRGPSTYSVVAWWGDTPVRLVEGVPQAGEVGGSSGGERHYTTRVAGSHAGLRLALTLASGAAKLYANMGAPAGAGASQHLWSSESLAGADERLSIEQADAYDAYLCADCDVFVAVVCIGPCEFALTAKSSASVAVLEDGAAANAVVNPGAYDYYKLYLSAKSLDLELILTVFSGNPDLYASVGGVADGVTRPNATHHDFASEDAAADVLLLGHASPKLAACQAAMDTCVVYVSVRGAAAGASSSFSLLATSYPVSSAFKILAPSILALEYDAYPADFGPALPRSPLLGAIVYARPGHACAPLENAEELRGKIALLDRGPQDDSVCPMPQAYFANKIARVQAAGAVGVVVANDREGGLVFMGAVSGDHAAQVTIPSVFVSKATGEQIKQYAGVAGGVTAQLAAPSNRVPLLVAGSPQHGVAAHSQWRYYELITPAGGDAVSITVAPDFGNPDLFVAVGTFPDSLHYTWSAESLGADTLTIAADDPKLCRLCILVVGVLGRASDAAFTVSFTTAEALGTLQAGVPLVEQRVRAGAYAWYRIWVGSASSGLTVAVTGQGDVDLYLSFTHARPREEGHAYERRAAGRNACDQVDCGATILGGDAIHVPANDPSICAGGRTPCLAYVGVTSAANTSFALLFSLETTERATSLVDGAAVTDAVRSAGSYRFYTFRVAADVSQSEAGRAPLAPSVTVAVTPTSGDPDLYVLGPLPVGDAHRPDRNGKGCAGLPLAGCGWSARSTQAAGESLVLRPLNAWACSPSCHYSIAVYGFSASTYTIVAVSESSAQGLIQGTPALGAVATNGTRRYTLSVADASLPVLLVLTPFSGNPSLFARNGGAPRLPGAPPPAAGASPTLSSQAPEGMEVLVVPAAAGCGGGGPAAVTDSCVLHAVVFGETGATYSLLATQQREGAPGVMLADGQPQAGAAAPGGRVDYSFWLLDPASGYSLSLAALEGRPRMLARLGGVPGEGEAATLGGDAQHPIEVGANGTNPGPVARVQVALLAGNATARWSLTARATGGARSTMLQDRVPILVAVPVATEASFSAAVPAGDTHARVCFTTLQGRVSATTESGTSAGGGVAGGSGGWCTALVANSRVTLRADASQSGASRVSAMLTLGATAAWGGHGHAPPMQLQDGVPQRLRLGGTVTERFRVASAADNLVTFAAAVADGTAAVLKLRAHLRINSGREQGAGGDAGGRGGGHERGGGDWIQTGEIGGWDAHAGTTAALSIGVGAEGLGAYECAEEGVRCELIFELDSSAPAEVTVTASTAATPTLLPLGVPVGGAIEATRGFSVAQYELLLDPSSIADDELWLHLERCAGDLAPPPVIRVSTTGPPPNPEDTIRTFGGDGTSLGLRGLAQSSKAFVSVSVNGGRLEYLIGAYGPGVGAPPTTSVPGDAGAIRLTYSGGALALRFEEPPAGDAEWLLSYELWQVAEEKRLGANLHTWCGVSRASQLLAKVTPAELRRDESGGGAVLSVELREDGRALCATAGPNPDECLRWGDAYSLTIVAVSTPAAGGVPRRAVYAPALWRAGHKHGGAGISFFFGLFLFLLLALLAYVAQWLVRRKLTGRHLAPDRATWGDFVDETRELCRDGWAAARRHGGAAAERGRELAIAGYATLRERVDGARAAPPSSSRGGSRTRVGDSMTAPLAASAAPMGVGSLPPLSSADVMSRADAPTSTPRGAYASPDAVRVAIAEPRVTAPVAAAALQLGDDDLFAEPVLTAVNAQASSPAAPHSAAHDPLGGSTVAPLTAPAAPPPADVDD